MAGVAALAASNLLLAVLLAHTSLRSVFAPPKFKVFWTEIQKDSERIKPYQDRVNEAKSSVSSSARSAAQQAAPAKSGEECRQKRRSKHTRLSHVLVLLLNALEAYRIYLFFTLPSSFPCPERRRKTIPETEKFRSHATYDRSPSYSVDTQLRDARRGSQRWTHWEVDDFLADKLLEEVSRLTVQHNEGPPGLTKAQRIRQDPTPRFDTLRRTRAASKIPDPPDSAEQSLARADVSRRASVPGSLYESSIVFDTSTGSDNPTTSQTWSANTFGTANPSLRMTPTHTSTSSSIIREDTTGRNTSPERVGLPMPSLVSNRASSLYSAYRRPQYRTTSLAQRAKTLVDRDPLQPEDIVDHGIDKQAYRTRFGVRPGFYTQVSTVVRELQALLYALAEEIPERARNRRVYRVDATNDLVDALLGQDRLEELMGAWEVLRERIENATHYIVKYFGQATGKDPQSPVSTEPDLYSRFAPQADISERIKEYRLLAPHHRLTYAGAESLTKATRLSDFVYVPPTTRDRFPPREPEVDPEPFSYDDHGVKVPVPKPRTNFATSASRLSERLSRIQRTDEDPRPIANVAVSTDHDSEYPREQDSEEEVNQSLLLDQPLATSTAVRVTDWQREAREGNRSPSELSYVTLRPPVAPPVTATTQMYANEGADILHRAGPGDSLVRRMSTMNAANSVPDYPPPVHDILGGPAGDEQGEYPTVPIPQLGPRPRNRGDEEQGRPPDQDVGSGAFTRERWFNPWDATNVRRSYEEQRNSRDRSDRARRSDEYRRDHTSSVSRAAHRRDSPSYSSGDDRSGHAPQGEALEAHLEEVIRALLEGDTLALPAEATLGLLAVVIPAPLEEDTQGHQEEDDDLLPQDLPAEVTDLLACQEGARLDRQVLQDGRAARTAGTQTSTYLW
ncbi:hypothetical protein BC629DRAFT_1446639 [Irpex lacteus]|nr:hypothetical protein BC629DRAFT_1446639 [Irpex lacteus]